jgi:DNA-binding transcriptional ArsR family regulator
MYSEQEAHFGTRAVILKALVHPTRLFMLEELSKKSRCVYALNFNHEYSRE